MKLATLASIKSVKGKRVLVRVDFNIPYGPNGTIGSEEDARIRASLPTIAKLKKGGAKIILVSHLGRPEGREKRYSLAPVAAHLSRLLGKKVTFIKDDFEDDDKVERQLEKMANGDVALLENIRFYSGEDKNSPFLARRLASLADVFVDDAFAVAHRTAASNVGVTKYLPSYAGLLLEKEVKQLGTLLDKPKHPFVVLMGGAKIASKIQTLKKLLTVADTILIGGGMANNFFAARGFKMGLSLMSPEDVRFAKQLLAKHGKKIMLPVDVLAATRLDEQAMPRYCAPNGLARDEHVVDIGAETVRAWAAILKKAKTIVWNGPVGLFEVKKFSHGSIALGRVIAARSSGKAFGVVGGGETVQCLAQTGMSEYVDHVSTGGGAMLEFLEGKILPGIKPLMHAPNAVKSKSVKAKKPAAAKKSRKK
jgi:phosphoglycerate kinase